MSQHYLPKSGRLPSMGANAGSANGRGPTSGVRAGSRAAALRSNPSVVDLSFQLAYKLAYRMMRVYWWARKPATHGALVALWNQGEVLLVQNSYVPYRSLPGGYVGKNETAVQAALRELREEIGLVATADQLDKVFDQVSDWEGKRDHVEIFTLALDQRPHIEIDNREVVSADWFSPERALKLALFPPLRAVIERVHGRSTR